MTKVKTKIDLDPVFIDEQKPVSQTRENIDQSTIGKAKTIIEKSKEILEQLKQKENDSINK